jgi:hypothetical protein
MAANIGEIKATIGADVKPLKSAEQEARASLGRMGGGFRALATKVIGVVAVFKTLQAAARAVGSALDRIDSEGKLARRLGGTTASVQSLTRAAELSGIEFGALAKSMEMVNRRLGEVQTGGAPGTRKALEALGLSAEQLLNLDVDERLAVMADRFRELGLSAAQQSAILREFGIRNTEIINLLEDGGDAIRGARDEIERLGVALTNVESRQIEQANDAMTSIGLTMRGFFNQVAVKIAPILYGIAEAFKEVAGETNGFRAQIDAAFTFLQKAIGYSLDLLSTLHRAWTIMSAGAVGAFNLIVQGYERVVTAFDRMMTAIRGESKERSEWVRKVQADAASAAAAYEAAVKHMHDTNREPWPSETLDNWVEKVRTASEEAAKAAEEAFKNRPAGGSLIFGTDAEGQQKQLEAQQAQLATRLEALRFALMNEEEQEIESYNRRLEEIAKFEEARAVTEQEARDLRERATGQHLENMTRMEDAAAKERKRIQDEEARARQQGWSTFWGNMEGLMNSSSRAMFNIGKTAAIASSIISAYEGFNKTMAAYPYPLNIAFAGASLAASFAKIAAIKSTQFGGGSGSSSAAGGGTVSSQALTGTGADAQTRRDQTIFVRGLNPNDLVRGSDLIEAINDAIDNGSRIKLVAT